MHVYGLCASGPRAGINFLSVMAVFLFLFVNISVNIYTILCEYVSEHLYNFFVPVSDGFGGGNLVESNALWNWVRETGVSSAEPPTTRAFLHSSQLQRACACACAPRITVHSTGPYCTVAATFSLHAPCRSSVAKCGIRCSWDRQAYLTDIRDGKPSLVPAQNIITKNLLFNSYSSTWPLVRVASHLATHEFLRS